MFRIVGMTILGLAGAVAVLVAQEPPPKGQKDKEAAAPMQPGDKKADKGDAKADAEKKEPAAPSGDSAEEIVKRLNQGFEEAEGRLGKKDPREQTQKIQDQIIRDLDELIKQKNPNC